MGRGVQEATGDRARSWGEGFPEACPTASLGHLQVSVLGDFPPSGRLGSSSTRASCTGACVGDSSRCPDPLPLHEQLPGGHFLCDCFAVPLGCLLEAMWPQPRAAPSCLHVTACHVLVSRALAMSPPSTEASRASLPPGPPGLPSLPGAVCPGTAWDAPRSSSNCGCVPVNK